MFPFYSPRKTQRFPGVFKGHKTEKLARNGLRHNVSPINLKLTLLEKCPYSEFLWSKCEKMRTRNGIWLEI